MIETDLLRQLGWPEKLINEVTRMSKEINKIGERQRVFEEPVFECSSDSGNSIHFYGTEINASIDIRIQDIGKRQ